MDKFLALLSNPAVVTVGAMVLEALFRIIPTEKPLGVLHLISKVTGSVATFLDKVLPQNLSAPK